ncbi:CARDB domain-containing protein [Aeoliella sp. SH292]|uniref:CARDB domain-containing protein n=1 Tax=Aeoliella sp. SH292 TaxID=3454464 RepID=UPI003F94A35D
MHRPNFFIRSFVAATLVTTSTLPATASDERTLSGRLAELRRSWSGEAKVEQVAHTEPTKRSMAGDLFDMLSGKQGEAVRVASRPEELVPPAPLPRAGSALTPMQEQPAAFDIGEALGGPLGRPVASQKTAQNAPAAPVKVASRPTGAPRRIASGDLALDLIGTTSSSQNTAGVGTQATKVPIAPIPSDELDVDSFSQAPSGDSAQGGFTSAADAAASAAMPNDSSSTEPESFSTEKVKELDAFAMPGNNASENASNWNTSPSATASETIEVQPPTDATGTSPAVTNSPTAERAFGGSAVVSDRYSEESDSSLATSAPAPSGATIAGPSQNSTVLSSGQLPQLVSRVAGPKTILVGREARYQVTIENRGSASADQLATEIVAPEWAEVIHASASSGTVQRPATDMGGTKLRWDVPSLASGRSQTLDLVLVPKTSQPLSLAVSCHHAPVATTTMVEVQEPKLSMALSGPNEVFFGRPQKYRLSLSNPGTGPAENIVVQLMPPGGNQAVSSYRVPRLAAGESKSVEIEITARDPGELAIKAIASADGDLRSETSQQVFCRQPQLNVDWRGPDRKYAGTEATYYFRVRNPGTASADQVAFDVALPAGFEFRTASDGHQFDAATQRVLWKIGTLRPGDDCYLELRGVLNQAGANEFRMSAENSEGDVRDAKAATTEVVALADLKLDIVDPKGPVPVGTEVVYDITVTNRGRSAAEEVAVVGLFSEGIEPLSAEGGEASIGDGRVGFHAISTLPAGQQVKLKIRAKALSAGTHLFRAEVVCRDLDIKLAAEETTRFFQDEASGASNGSPLGSTSRQSRFE